MTKLLGNWGDRLGLSFLSRAQADEPDLARRAILTGGAAVVACAVAVAALPSPAAAQIEFRFGDNHSRRRSSDEHSRRRSRDAHSRRRSRDHGRRRSRREFRNWNENCFPTPFGWICT